jgi:hypothetical protein
MTIRPGPRGADGHPWLVRSDPARPHDESPIRMRREAYARAFIAGFLSTLIFHQGVLTLLWLSGATRRVPYDMSATPLGVPAVLSLAFWGGVWGALIWPLSRNAPGRAYWIRALLIGALAPSAVSLFVVMPLKAMPVAGGWDPKIIVVALVLNGAWGLGVALFMRITRTRRDLVSIRVMP